MLRLEKSPTSTNNINFRRPPRRIIPAGRVRPTNDQRDPLFHPIPFSRMEPRSPDRHCAARRAQSAASAPLRRRAATGLIVSCDSSPSQSPAAALLPSIRHAEQGLNEERGGEATCQPVAGKIRLATADDDDDFRPEVRTAPKPSAVELRAVWHRKLKRKTKLPGLAANGHIALNSVAGLARPGR